MPIWRAALERAPLIAPMPLRHVHGKAAHADVLIGRTGAYTLPGEARGAGGLQRLCAGWGRTGLCRWTVSLDHLQRVIRRDGCRCGHRRFARDAFRRLSAREPARGLCALAESAAGSAAHETRDSAVPVLFLAGELDPVSPPDWAREIAASFPNGRIASMPHGAHMLDGLSGLDTCLDAATHPVCRQRRCALAGCHLFRQHDAAAFRGRAMTPHLACCARGTDIRVSPTSSCSSTWCSCSRSRSFRTRWSST